MPILFRLTVTETRLFLREPVVVFFAVAFAPILLIVLGSVSALREPDPAFGGLRRIDLYLPIVVAMGLALFSLNGLSPVFASYREKGVLRRLRTTPVRPVTMIYAQFLMAALFSVTTLLVVLAIGRVAFDVPLPRQVAAFLLAYVLMATATFAIGLLVAALAPTAKSAGAIGPLVFFPLMFFAGLWIPRAEMNHVLHTISDWTPLGAGVQSLQDATAGQWPDILSLTVLLGWTLVAAGLAVRSFRWE